jgi:hypothetical protein
MKNLLASFAIGIVGVSVGVGSGLAQSGLSPDSVVTEEGATPTTRSATTQQPATYSSGGSAGARGVRAEKLTRASEAAVLQGQIRQLTQHLREATDDTTKADLTKQLETLVGKWFDEDLKSREAQLTQLEERVSKLRAQLDRRRKAKGEITQLQTKVLVNEADGLGFSGTPLEGRYSSNEPYGHVGEPIEYSNRQLGVMFQNTPTATFPTIPRDSPAANPLNPPQLTPAK